MENIRKNILTQFEMRDNLTINEYIKITRDFMLIRAYNSNISMTGIIF